MNEKFSNVARMPSDISQVLKAAIHTIEAQTYNWKPGAGLGTNWITLSGSELTNFSTLPVDAANGSVFLRLILP